MSTTQEPTVPTTEQTIHEAKFQRKLVQAIAKLVLYINALLSEAIVCLEANSQQTGALYSNMISSHIQLMKLREEITGVLWATRAIDTVNDRFQALLNEINKLYFENRLTLEDINFLKKRAHSLTSDIHYPYVLVFDHEL